MSPGLPSALTPSLRRRRRTGIGLGCRGRRLARGRRRRLGRRRRVAEHARLWRDHERCIQLGKGSHTALTVPSNRAHAVDPAAGSAHQVTAAQPTLPKSGRDILGSAALRGALAGAVGAAAMTAAEKLEQLIDGRPDSYVPARTLLAVFGRRPPVEDRPVAWNHVMQWGTGMVVGALRGVWSAVGIRGLLGSGGHAIVRLSVDQTLENVTGVGAPPTRWPVRELIIDVAHKVIYAGVTGAVADHWIRPRLEAVHGDEQGPLHVGR